MFLSDIHLPTISDDNYNICEAEITEDNLLVALKTISNNKIKNFMKLLGKI